MSTENTLKEAIIKLSPFKKTTFLPQTKVVEAEFSAVSKIGGLPYLRHKEDWPICPNCQKHQQLFLQLDMSQLPENQSEGLVQLFYCTSRKPNCEDDLSAFFPHSKAVTCRKIKIEGEAITIIPNIDEVFEEKQITGWEAKDDYPHPEDLYELDLGLNDEQMEALYDSEYIASQGDKLFGYPYWVQGTEYPNDSKDEPMEMLFQLDSEKNLPFMFGDVGIGHLSKSKNNEEEMAFGWACH